MYRELLTQVQGAKKSYMAAQKKASTEKGKAEGVLLAIDTSIANTQKEYKACIKGQETMTKAAKAIEKYTSEGLKGVYAGLEKMLENNLSQMNGSRIVVSEKEDKNGKVKLEIAVMEPSGTGSGEDKRDLARDCGHGIGELVSLFLTCSLIKNSSGAKILMLDEFVSGVSSENLSVVDSVLQYMHDNGFIVVVNEHGFIPSNADVYDLVNTRGKSKCVNVWHNDRAVCRDLTAQSE